jgi:hypothetical protein
VEVGFAAGLWLLTLSAVSDWPSEVAFALPAFSLLLVFSVFDFSAEEPFSGGK